MKTQPVITKYFLWIFALVAVCELASCDEDEPSTPTKTKQEQVKEILTTSPWKVNSVTVDKVETSVYKDLVLTFTDKGFTATNGGSVWPATGTWSFTSDAATTIKRNDNVEVAIEATKTSLKATLTWDKTTLAVGRSQALKGEHVFNFGK